MATEVTYSEIHCYVKVHSHLQTQRTVQFNLLTSSFRFINVLYIQFLFNRRYAYFQTNPFVSEQHAITQGIIHDTSSRFAFTEKGLPSINDRYAIFIPNANRIVSTTQLILPFTYFSDIKAFVGNTITTQRYANYTTQSIDYRYGFVQKFRSKYTSTPRVQSVILHFNDTHCYVETLQRYTLRNTCLVLGTYSEKVCKVQLNDKLTVTTPKVYLTLKGIYSEKIGTVRTYSPFTNRYAFVQRNPDTIRYATFNYNTPGERVATYLTSQVRMYHDTTLIQCHPYYNERVGVTRGYQYFTERIGLFKHGQYQYVLKPVYSSSPKLTVLSKNQKDAVFRVYTETNTEVHTDGVAISQITQDVKFRSVAGLTSNDKITATLVEAIKGTALTDSVEYRRKVLTIGKWIARCVLRFENSRACTLSSYETLVTEKVGATEGCICTKRVGVTSSYETLINERNTLYSYRTSTEQVGVTSAVLGYSSDRTATFHYTVVDIRLSVAFIDSGEAVVKDTNGNVYVVYIASDNNLAIKPTNKSYHNTYVGTKDGSKVGLLTLDESNNLTVEPTDTSNYTNPPTVKDENGNIYHLYIDDSYNLYYE